MNIYITGNGNLNSYYMQTLCLLYFPGEGFKVDENSRWCRVHVENNGKESCACVYLGDWAEGKSLVGHGKVTCSALATDDVDKADKISAGLAFMEAAGKFTGYTPPWGILTGVRPARVVSALLDSGMSVEAAADYLRDTYKTTESKAKLACDVSVAERSIITGDQSKDCSIYVAIPFCPSRCRYCSFVSVSSPGLLKLIPEYLPALKKDIKNVTDTIKTLGLNVKSVYIGGGTPSILEADDIADLLAYINESVGYRVPEFTFEAGRPDTITKEKLDAVRQGGVTRISVNTQTMNDAVLSTIGRNHTSDDFLRAYDIAVASGIPQINVDLIAGLPGESAESFIASSEKIVALAPQDITVHTFTVKRSSDYGLSDLYSRESAETELAVSGSAKIIGEGGYIPYYMYRQKNTVGNLENVGYSMPGHECLYNIYMMEEIHTVFGVGASSVTRLTLHNKNSGEQIIERVFEPKYPYEYLREHGGDAGNARRSLLREKSVDFYKTHG